MCWPKHRDSERGPGCSASLSKQRGISSESQKKNRSSYDERGEVRIWRLRINSDPGKANSKCEDPGTS